MSLRERRNQRNRENGKDIYSDYTVNWLTGSSTEDLGNTLEARDHAPIGADVFDILSRNAGVDHIGYKPLFGELSLLNSGGLTADLSLLGDSTLLAENTSKSGKDDKKGADELKESVEDTRTPCRESKRLSIHIWNHVKDEETLGINRQQCIDRRLVGDIYERFKGMIEEGENVDERKKNRIECEMRKCFGLASRYGNQFEGEKTTSGLIFHQADFVAAMPFSLAEMPQRESGIYTEEELRTLFTHAKVTYKYIDPISKKEKESCVVVRVIDNGPFIKLDETKVAKYNKGKDKNSQKEPYIPHINRLIDLSTTAFDYLVKDEKKAVKSTGRDYPRPGLLNIGIEWPIGQNMIGSCGNQIK